MQFYLNGYAPGDPDLRAAAPGVEQRPAGLPDLVGAERDAHGRAYMDTSRVASKFLKF